MGFYLDGIIREMNKHDKDCLLLALTGIAVALGYGLCDIDFGGVKLSHTEAWANWVAQPYVLSGILLTVFSLLLYKGFTWVRWAIFFWGPATLVLGIGWASARGIGNLDWFDTIPLLLLFAIWLWGTWDIVRKRAEPTTSSSV